MAILRSGRIHQRVGDAQGGQDGGDGRVDVFELRRDAQAALAPVIRLSYGRMVVLALPYTITMSITGLLATYYFM